MEVEIKLQSATYSIVNMPFLEFDQSWIFETNTKLES